jgi:hypothetical protein
VLLVVFHRETRAAGTAINTFTNLIMTFVVGQTFLSMLCAMKFGVSAQHKLGL